MYLFQQLKSNHTAFTHTFFLFAHHPVCMCVCRQEHRGGPGAGSLASWVHLLMAPNRASYITHVTTPSTNLLPHSHTIMLHLKIILYIQILQTNNISPLSLKKFWTTAFFEVGEEFINSLRSTGDKYSLMLEVSEVE